MPSSPIEQLIMENLVTRLQAMKAGADYTYTLATVGEVKQNPFSWSDAKKPAVLVTTEEEIPFVLGGDVNEGFGSPPLGELLVYRQMPVTLSFALDAAPTERSVPSSVDRSKEGRLMLADLYKCVMAMDHQDIGGSPIDIRASG